MAHLFRTPQYSFIGADALADAATVFPRLGKKALIVTGQSMIRQGHVATLEALLDQEGVGHARFSEITGEPTDTMIDAGLAVYQQEECDFAIGFGGGSALDAAKARRRGKRSQRSVAARSMVPLRQLSASHPQPVQARKQRSSPSSPIPQLMKSS